MARYTQVRCVAEDAVVAALALKLEVWLLHHTLHLIRGPKVREGQTDGPEAAGGARDRCPDPSGWWSVGAKARWKRRADREGTVTRAGHKSLNTRPSERHDAVAADESASTRACRRVEARFPAAIASG